jgi:acyl-CoA synthetase (AMP-forming)/AMP-acid ligase II/acyl carrier protein
METVLDLVHQASALAPDKPAFVDVEQRTINWSDLQEHIQRLGGELRRRGVGPDDRVALVLPDGPMMAVAFLGVASCCACAPLNPNYKERDFAFYIGDLKPKAVMLPESMDSPVESVAAEHNIPVWRMSCSTDETTFSIHLEDGSDEAGKIPEMAKPDAVALILHTSGTTSRPKMVPLSQRNLATSAANIAKILGLTPSDRGLMVMPLFHIHGLIGALLSSICAGASVICAPGFDGEQFLNWARAGKATWYSAVPTMHQAILTRALEFPEETRDIHFRLIRSSSASLPPKVFADLEAQWQAPVIESYGMTEATHQMTSNPMPPGVQKPGSVGVPAGPEVAVLDESGKPLPAGKTGAIVIRGASVTQGYANNEAANKEAFVNGWFHTGDQGYFDGDGYLFLTGRLKEMVNRGGENIAPREIDEALLEHPAVAQATAFAVPHESLGEDLAAAVVLKSGQSIDENALREFLAEKVADFKVPSRIVFVQQIPKGPTGKLQRIGLHEKLADALTVEFAKAETRSETLVADAYKEVIGLELVGMNDNFFFLGGDSLKAMRVVARINQSTGQSFPVSAVFRFPTPRSLAAEVDKAMENGDDDLDALVDKLSKLPPEEVARLLEESENS